MYRDDENALLAKRTALESQIAEETGRLELNARRLSEVGWITRSHAQRQRRRRISLTLAGLALLLAGIYLSALALVLHPNSEQIHQLNLQAELIQKEVSGLDQRRGVRRALVDLVSVAESKELAEVIGPGLEEERDAWKVLGVWGCFSREPRLTMLAMSALNELEREELLERCLLVSRE